MALRLPPPIIALACLAAAYGFDFVIATPVLAPQSGNVVAAAVFIVGAATIVVPAIRGFRSKGTTFHPWKEGQDLSALVVEGPYRWSCNPMYVGLALATAGIAALVGTAMMLVAPLLFVLILELWVIPWEERALLARFGDAYAAYKSRVRRWL